MKRAWVVLGLVMGATAAWAGGPRFVQNWTHPRPGQPMAFGSSHVRYFTDAGRLNSVMDHAAADALVAAAAATWNVPAASLVLDQGGTLGEDVSSSNVYFDGTSVVFPADVQATNAASMPIAVIYDSDGAVIDLLLGAGASAVSSCRQNAVIESVDALGAGGTIDHAMLIVNGKCVTSAVESQKQMQYMLMRAFGRVLGMGWSQVNDNVFTQTPAPNQRQVANWPVMHPIDVLCGTYSYQCMTNPFTLRPDDVSVLSQLYPVTTANLTAGKVLSNAAGTINVSGWMMFTDTYNTQADMMNVSMVLQSADRVSDYEVASSLTGWSFANTYGNPVTADPAMSQVDGTAAQNMRGYYLVNRLPVASDTTLVRLKLQAVNPLYVGAYALGTMQRPPSATPTSATEVESLIYTTTLGVSYKLPDTPTVCNTPTTGHEDLPVPADSTGWWSDVLCGMGAPSWRTTPLLRGGHSWTLETYAMDETGALSLTKMQPVMGVWKTADALGTKPTVAAAVVPMNAPMAGVTQLKVAAAAGDASYRIVVADQFGGGRPDYLYRTRLLYADTVLPLSLGAGGGQITITGTGFANGNRVTVNGVVAKVLSWTANTIVATAPAAAAVGSKGVPVSVAVTDLTTGAVTEIAGAVTYAGAGAHGLVQVSAPTALTTGTTAATVFSARVLAADGVTAVPGAQVRLGVTGGASLVACGAAVSCVVVSDAGGLVSSAVAGVSAGSVSLTATEVSGGASVQASLMDKDPVRSVVLASAAAWVAAGAGVSLPVVLNAVQDGAAAGGVAVRWSATAGLVLSAASTSTSGSGAAGVSVGSNAMAAGTAQVVGCAWTTVCAAWTLTAVDEALWVPSVVSGAGQSVAASAGFQSVVVLVTDGAGHALPGAAVTVAQTVTAWAGECPAQGRCAAAPVLAQSSTSAVTGLDGTVSFAPLEVSGTAGVTNVAVSTGTSGFVSLSLVKR